MAEINLNRVGGSAVLYILLLQLYDKQAADLRIRGNFYCKVKN
jgi:hypothetical protein